MASAALQSNFYSSNTQYKGKARQDGMWQTAKKTATPNKPKAKNEKARSSGGDARSRGEQDGVPITKLPHRRIVLRGHR
jgi:hypothetical protein